jgi:hypothetical protein
MRSIAPNLLTRTPQQQQQQHHRHACTHHPCARTAEPLSHRQRMPIAVHFAFTSPYSKFPLSNTTCLTLNPPSCRDERLSIPNLTGPSPSGLVSPATPHQSYHQPWPTVSVSLPTNERFRASWPPGRCDLKQGPWPFCFNPEALRSEWVFVSGVGRYHGLRGAWAAGLI